MTVNDLATRAYNHAWAIDPIIRSLLDTDFYKLLMAQTILRHRPSVPVTFGLINRTHTVKLADEVSETELRAQLDHVRTLKLRPNERIWLAGNTFYGTAAIFRPDFLEWLSHLQLPDYRLQRNDRTGQYNLTFTGTWPEVTLWEIYALSIVNELRTRKALAGLKANGGRLALDILYAQAKTTLFRKLQMLRPLTRDTVSPLRIADFGTRRRHSFLWQDWANEAARQYLGESYIGTSNVYIAMTQGLEAIGTNAHELPMVLAALAESDEALAQAPYDVLDLWKADYGENLRVFLPDAYGTTRFLANAPAWLATWRGMRPDSKEPKTAADEAIAWWSAHGQDPRGKLLTIADGMDADSIIATHAYLRGRVQTSFGWGTNLTNDFGSCDPLGSDRFKAISLVCKVVAVEGRPAVKLSDNASKATGPVDEIARYRRIFGTDGVTNIPVRV